MKAHKYSETCMCESCNRIWRKAVEVALARGGNKTAKKIKKIRRLTA